MLTDNAVANNAAPADQNKQDQTTLAAQTPPDTGAGWLTGLPQEVRAVMEAKAYKTPADLAQAYINAEKFIGSSDKVALPKDGVWDADALKRLGVPEKPDGYALKRPDNLPAGMTYDENFEKAALPVLHKAGIPPAAAQQLLDMFVGYQTAQHEASIAKRATEGTETVNALKAEWGQKYEANTALAQRAARHFGGQQFVDMLNTTGVGNNADFIRTFAKVGALIAEDTLKNGVSTGALSPEMAKAEIAKLQKEKAYTNRDDPEHATVLKKMEDLYAIAYPAAA